MKWTQKASKLPSVWPDFADIFKCPYVPMVTTALSAQSSHRKAFNNAAHLLYCQYDAETCQKAGQLDVHLKMASQVVRPWVFCKHTPCTAPCRHIERALWGPESSYFLFLASVADVLFKQNQHDTQSSHLNHTHWRWLQTYKKVRVEALSTVGVWVACWVK